MASLIFITGSTDGLGRRVAERSAKPGVHLLLHGRDPERGEQVSTSIRGAGAEATFLKADFASLADVKQLAGTVLERHRQLDVLVNNAGFADWNGPRHTSHDGYELNFAVNYLAPFCLTELLKPILGAEGPSRIVNVAAAGQAPIDFDDVMLSRSYDGRRACARSKLAQVMHTFDLAREIDPSRVTANALHPATFMDTTMVRANGIRPVNSVDNGADAVLGLVTRSDLAKRSGLYFEGAREGRANAQAYASDARDRLRALSIEAVEKVLGSSWSAPVVSDGKERFDNAD